MLELANTITADMGMIPGLAFVGPAFGLPLSALSAFVERPFYTAGGVRSNTLWYSLQANLVSLIVGLPLCIMFGLLMSILGLQASDDAFFLAWPAVAVACSIVIERTYVARRAGAGASNVSWVWSAVGNIVSAAICVAILFAVVSIRETHPEIAHAVTPVNTELTVIAFGGSAALFVASFIVPRKRRAGATP
jgi:hypothetical protein